MKIIDATTIIHQKIPNNEKRRKMSGIGRFQVMAILQAARAYTLGLDINEAKSWGLNRAIFYAAAKKGYFRKKPPTRKFVSITQLIQKPVEKEKEFFYLGDESAYFEETPNGIRFKIGGKIQRPEDYDKQIASKFWPIYEEIWKEALKIVSEHPKEVLLSQRKFYKQVYEPLRDILVDRWRKKVLEARKEK